jgi:hypothetical protein
MASDFPTGIQPIPDRYVGLDDAETFGRLISRPDRIDENAQDFFNQWIAGIPKAVTIVSGDYQTGETGTVLGEPLVVKVLDSRGNPVAGAPVAFRVRDPGARIDGRAIAIVLTTQEGKATAARWRLGRTLDTQHVDVRVGSANVFFSAKATPPGYSTSTPRQQSKPSDSRPKG